MNFGHNRLIGRPDPLHKDKKDSMSVHSVISQGGSIIKGFGLFKNDSQK